MLPKLQIQSTPIRIQYVTEKAEHRIRSFRPQCHVSRTRNGLSIRSQPAQIKISSRGLKESILTLKPTLTLLHEIADEGTTAAKEATADAVEFGNAMKKSSIADIIAQKNAPKIETELAFIPHSGVDIEVTDPVLEIEYIPDEVECRWDIRKPYIEYIPYRVSFEVVQYPELSIRFIDTESGWPQNPALLKQQRNAFLGNNKESHKSENHKHGDKV